MKLLMDGWFPGGLPGGRADAEGPVSAKWQVPLMEMILPKMKSTIQAVAKISPSYALKKSVGHYLMMSAR